MFTGIELKLSMLSFKTPSYLFAFLRSTFWLSQTITITAAGKVWLMSVLHYCIPAIWSDFKWQVMLRCLRKWVDTSVIAMLRFEQGHLDFVCVCVFFQLLIPFSHQILWFSFQFLSRSFVCEVSRLSVRSVICLWGLWHIFSSITLTFMLCF